MAHADASGMTVCQHCRSLTKPVGANLAVCGRCDRLQVVPQESAERPWLAARRIY